MSDEKSGSNSRGGSFDAPKKPKATFGDVMLGIPAGRSGEERGGGGRERSKSGGAPSQQDDRKRSQPAAKAPRPEEKKQGPLVVVRRASGAVETRELEGAAPAQVHEDTAATASAGAEGSAPSSRSVTPVTPSPLYEEVPENESFAEMFEQASKDGRGPSKKSLRVGEKVKGTIFQLGADTAFVSLGGGKSEAMIELRELKDDEGILRQGVGDTIEAHVVEIGARGIILSRALAKGSASLAMLAEARASGMPVEGLVLSVNKGGLEVAIGDVRAFCPVSQIDVRFVEKPDQFVGEKLKFRVTEVRERNVVLSRRSLLEEEQKALAGETRKTLGEGKIVKGKVTGVREFGVFVDLGGIEGMIPVSELSHVRVTHPSEVTNVGDLVEVEILRMEAGQPNSSDKSKQKERITLSMRSRQADPFLAAIAEIHEGDRLQGKVVRLQPFGAFVELRPGVDGLVHISALSDKRIAHPKDVVAVGDTVWVSVEKVDPSEKRIGLRRITEEEAQKPAEPRAPQDPSKPRTESAPRPAIGQIVTGKIDRIEPYGVFVAFPGGKGLVPASETGTERGTDMKRHFSMGQELKVAILDIDAANKIRLSVTGAARAEERADMEAWVKSQPKAAGAKGLGTFADLFKKK